MTHHPRHVIMSFYDVPAESLEMVHQLFEHLSEVTQGSCNFNVMDPRAGDEILVPVELEGRYVGEAAIDDEGCISTAFGRGQRGLILRQQIVEEKIHVLDIQPRSRSEI